jgi:hypothetical protein
LGEEALAALCVQSPGLHPDNPSLWNFRASSQNHLC